jgi:hypothetical protein
VAVGVELATIISSAYIKINIVTPPRIKMYLLLMAETQDSTI